jgi:PII-like signaling protein
MLKEGRAQQVVIYIAEDVRQHGEPIYLALLNYLFRQGISGAMVTKGVAGFGADHHLHTTRILELSENLPIKIEFVETHETLDTLLPALLQMVPEGLVVRSEVEVIRYAHRTAGGTGT